VQHEPLEDEPLEHEPLEHEPLEHEPQPLQHESGNSAPSVQNPGGPGSNDKPVSGSGDLEISILESSDDSEKTLAVVGKANNEELSSFSDEEAEQPNSLRTLVYSD